MNMLFRAVLLACLSLTLSLSLIPGLAAPAQAQEKPGEGLRIVFFLGGSEGSPFSTIVKNGAEAARDLLGCEVRYVWSGWNADVMIAQFKEVLAEKPDGVAIMGHPGSAAFAPLVEEARARGIVVTSQNTDLPELEEKYKAKGFGYVGQELYAAGRTLALAAAGKAGLAKGDRAMVWGLLGDKNRGERTKGAIDALKELGLIVDYLPISDEVNADPTLGAAEFVAYAESRPDLKLVVTDHGDLTANTASYLRAARIKPGQVFVAGFDLSPETAAAIKEGRVNVILDQQPWLQGFFPVMQIYLTKRYGFSGLHIDTGGAVIDAELMEAAKPLVEKGIR